MSNALAANFTRLASLIRSAIRDPKFHTFGAAMIVLAALAWELARSFIGQSDNLVLWAMAASFFVILGALLFAVGAVVWLIVVLAVTLVRGRLSEETKPHQAWPAIVLAVASLVFLGVPEVSEKLAWWQENVFSHIPDEPTALEACGTYFRDPFNIIGLVFIAGMGWLFFRHARRKFPERLHRAAAIFKGLITGRNWRAPAVLAAAIALTVAALAVYHAAGWFLAIVLVQLAALFIWLFWPLIRQYLFQLLFVVAWLVPSFIVNARVGDPVGLLSFLIWPWWLSSPMTVRPWPWRFVFWAGILGFAGYIVYGPGSV